MNQKEKLKSRKFYYLEKVIKLNRKLFIEVGDARSRICNCEEFIEAAYSASKGAGLEKEVEENWEICWNELNGDGDSYWFDKKGNMIGSPICGSIRNRRNKSMEKYLDFFYGELLRVLNKEFI